MDTEDRARILVEARSWIGTPYHHKGRVKGVGVDCGGLLYEVYSTQFQLMPYPDFYAMDWALHRSDELYTNFLGQYISETRSTEPADIVVFRYGRCFSHGGILTETGRVIHAWGSQQRGQVMESPMSFFGLRPRKFFKVSSDV
jgi:NlpC/P60 family putative phage cell wall peptidase